jgi:hypothetical protein
VAVEGLVIAAAAPYEWGEGNRTAVPMSPSPARRWPSHNLDGFLPIGPLTPGPVGETPRRDRPLTPGPGGPAETSPSRVWMFTTLNRPVVYKNLAKGHMRTPDAGQFPEPE